MELLDIYDNQRQLTGRTIWRGEPHGEGEFFLAVHVWIRNSSGEYLISQRAPEKTYPGMWECTTGRVASGEDTASAAVREAKEELGVSLCMQEGCKIHEYGPVRYVSGDYFFDVWLFRHEAPIEEIVLQQGETSAARWVSASQLLTTKRGGSLRLPGSISVLRLLPLAQKSLAGKGSFANGVASRGG